MKTGTTSHTHAQTRARGTVLPGLFENVEKSAFFQIISMERALQQEQHRACVLQHSLDDRIAELDLERVAKDVRI